LDLTSRTGFPLSQLSTKWLIYLIYLSTTKHQPNQSCIIGSQLDQSLIARRTASTWVMLVIKIDPGSLSDNNHDHETGCWWYTDGSLEAIPLDQWGHWQVITGCFTEWYWCYLLVLYNNEICLFGCCLTAHHFSFIICKLFVFTLYINMYIVPLCSNSQSKIVFNYLSLQIVFNMSHMFYLNYSGH